MATRTAIIATIYVTIHPLCCLDGRAARIEISQVDCILWVRKEATSMDVNFMIEAMRLRVFIYVIRSHT